MSALRAGLTHFADHLTSSPPPNYPLPYESIAQPIESFARFVHDIEIFTPSTTESSRSCSQHVD
jgi:hypothetical protein